MRRMTLCALVLYAAAASAQQRPLFDPDDFLDPQQYEGAVFLSRLVIGGVKNGVDDFRPLRQDAGFVHVTNSLHWSRFQLDYKRTEMRGEQDSDPADITVCDCNENPSAVIFPTPPPEGAIPAPPLPGSRDTLQFAFYRIRDYGEARRPVTLRYRLTVSRQPIETVVHSYSGTERFYGRERSIGVDADTHFRIAGRDFFGSLLYARNRRTGTLDDHDQHELAYVSRFRIYAAGPILIRPTLTVGAVSGRDARGINVVSPAVELFWHERRTFANLHLVWSPHVMRSGVSGWRTTHQVALFADRALYVKLFRGGRS